MKELQRTTTSCIPAAAALMCLVFPDPCYGSDVPPNELPPEVRAIFGDSIPILPPSDRDRSRTDKRLGPEDLKIIREVFAERGSALPLTKGPPEDKLAPEWSAWRELYTSLNRLPLESVPPQERLLGLTPSEADAVLQAGQDYLWRLSRINEDADAEIQARFGYRYGPPLPAGIDPRRVV